MRAVLFGIFYAFAAGMAVAPASADCTCRAPGFLAHHGETVCLKTATGPRLARCEMVLNNASWKFLPEPCPEASLEPAARASVAMSLPPANARVVLAAE